MNCNQVVIAELALTATSLFGVESLAVYLRSSLFAATSEEVHRESTTCPAQEMTASGIPKNAITFNSAVSTCGRPGCWFFRGSPGF